MRVIWLFTLFVWLSTGLAPQLAVPAEEMPHAQMSCHDDASITCHDPAPCDGQDCAGSAGCCAPLALMSPVTLRGTAPARAAPRPTFLNRMARSQPMADPPPPRA